MSFESDIEGCLNDLEECPEYIEWSTFIQCSNFEHYESDPDYEYWVQDTQEKRDEEYSLLDSFGLLENEVDWESLFVEWDQIPLSVEEETFYEAYCI